MIKIAIAIAIRMTAAKNKTNPKCLVKISGCIHQMNSEKWKVVSRSIQIKARINVLFSLNSNTQLYCYRFSNFINRCNTLIIERASEYPYKLVENLFSWQVTPYLLRTKTQIP